TDDDEHPRDEHRHERVADRRTAPCRGRTARESHTLHALAEAGLHGAAKSTGRRLPVAGRSARLLTVRRRSARLLPVRRCTTGLLAVRGRTALRLTVTALLLLPTGLLAVARRTTRLSARLPVRLLRRR